MKTFINKFLLILIISLFLEIIVFNFNTFRSFFYSHYDINANLYYEQNFKNEDDCNILPFEEEYSTIEIYNINQKINNIYIDFEIEGEKQIVGTSIYLSDEGNEELYSSEFGDGMIWNQNSSSSHYATINSYGKTNTIVIKICKESTELLKIRDIKLNVIRPIFFSLYRFSFVFAVLLIINAFIFDNKLHKFTFSNTSIKVQNIVIYSLIIFQIISGILISNINLYLKNDYKNEQYQLLTNSLIEGKFDLDLEVDNSLLELDNPYDLSKRINNDVKYKYDTAYYNGKYYCYFGITPVLLFYLPYKLLTGKFISDCTVGAILFAVLSISIVCLFVNLIRKYFKNTPLSIFALISIFSINTCGALTLLSEPRIYTIPVLCGLSLSIAALSLWTNSIREDKGLKNSFLVVGSLCMGLAIGSRPQFALMSFFAIIIFFDKLKDFKNNYIYFTCAISPLIIIGSFLMYYNYSRFGSLFDFGANYNLTLNDMTRRGFKLDRINDGIFYYLLQPVSLTNVFPYINEVAFETNYIGMLIHEYSFGGLFAINPLTILSIYSFKLKNIIKNKKFFITSIMMVIFGFIIMMLDTQMAGLVERYFTDFSIYFVLSSVIVVLTFFDYYSNNRQIFNKIVFMLVFFALAYSILRLFADSYMTLETCNPRLYFKIYCLTQF